MVKHELEKIIQGTLKELSVVAESVLVEHPAEDTHGDYSTNIALVYAKQAGENPKSFAEKIKNKIEERDHNLIKKVEIAGPGFINITLTDEAVLNEISILKDSLSSGFGFHSGEKINIEFISANPTGALHIGHGRGAFYGDVLANVLSYSGADIAREYYINDSRESAQIKELGKTALGKGEQYRTEKTQDIIKEISFAGLNESEAGLLLASKIQEENKRFIEKGINIKFDNWYSEDEKLRATGANERMLEVLKKFTYEKDGALWLKTSEYGDDEDRVVVRSDGTATYFLSDIAYHADKSSRGYDIVVDVWGADHHGHVKRMMAVKKMLDWKNEFKIFITQLVSLKEDGETKKMSKRAGNVILLEDLVNEFGIDVVRWFFSEKSLNTHMDFDAELAKQQSEKNPVYYVQYAHARICSILEKTKELKADKNSLADVLKEKNARALAMKILEFPETIKDISNDHQVNKLTVYAYGLANEFSKFYHDVRVVRDDTYNEGALEIITLTKNTLAKTLGLLGISAPEKM